jgi:hypothetical protein
MKGFSSCIMIATVGVFMGGSLQAQYKAPSQYFRKDSPPPKRVAQPTDPVQPPTPKAPEKQAPAVPAPAPVPRFKDLATNSQFYFLSDTNRAYPWTKVSLTTATNTKNGATAAINGETPIQR